MNREPEELRQYNEIIEVLGGDAERAQAEWHRDPTNQFLRRSYVRAGFAYVEGHIFSLKQLTLSLDSFKRQLQSLHGVTPGHVVPTLLTLGERLISEEQTFDLDDKGKVYSKAAFVRLEKNIKFAFLAFAKATDIPFQLDLGSGGWDAFQRSVGVRNRITHPKTTQDLTISEIEMTTFCKGLAWYLESSNKCITILTQVFADRSKRRNEA
jgi:hypothetical protein